jgi:DNA-binding response OmpR family regulator
MSNTIMVVEDDPQARRLMDFLLTNEGFKVVWCEDGKQALARIEATNPDLVLLDLMMPNLDGIGFTQRLRELPHFHKLPVLVVTARDQQIDKYEAFQVGANAFLTKPFDPIELVLNIRSLLSLSSGSSGADVPVAIEAKGLRLDPARYLAIIGQRTIQLTKMETAVLFHLMRHPGVVFSAEQLSEAVHDTNRSVDAIHAHIRNIRNKIESDAKRPIYVVTQGRKGYYFDAVS